MPTATLSSATLSSAALPSATLPVRERTKGTGIRRPARAKRRWDEALGPVVTAVESAATGLKVSAEDVLAAVLAQFGLAADVPPASDAAALTRQLGPYLSGRAVQQRAGISRQALHGRRTRWAVIGVPTDDHVDPTLYPARQFADIASATVLPGVQQVARALAEGIDDPLTIAIWLDSAHPRLDDQTAYTWLAAGRDPDAVTAAARADALLWRQ